MWLTCHQALGPEIIGCFVAIDAALEFRGFPVRFDSNLIQISEIDLNAGESGSVRGQRVAPTDCVKRNVVVIGVLHLR